jgi:HSP20 family protein
MAELVKTRPRRRSWPRVPSLFQDLMGDFLVTPWQADLEQPAAMWSPRMDLIESDGAYELHMDLPGLSKDDVSIDVENHRLVVHGQRQEETRKDDDNVVRMERHFGRFYRSLTLPETALPEKAKATFEDGVLTIRIPKSEAKKPKKISIQAPKR